MSGCFVLGGNVVWGEKEGENQQEGLLADRGRGCQDCHQETGREVLQEEGSS